MTAFRTIEVSDASRSPENLRFVTVKSEHLRGRGDVTLFVPDGLEAPAPMLLLLHGVYGSHWSWTYKGGGHEIAQDLIDREAIQPLVMAMPSDGLWGDGSGYLPHPDRDFQAWITEDVLKLTREVVEPVTASSTLFMGGLSMGGYGALRIGCLDETEVCAVSAHSSITRVEQMEQFVEEPLDRYTKGGCERLSVAETIRKNRGTLPALRFDCGTDDDLLEANRTLHRQLDRADVSHTYEEHPGGHEWSYWRERLVDSLRFFDRVS